MILTWYMLGSLWLQLLVRSLSEPFSAVGCKGPGFFGSEEAFPTRLWVATLGRELWITSTHMIKLFQPSESNRPRIPICSCGFITWFVPMTSAFLPSDLAYSAQRNLLTRRNNMWLLYPRLNQLILLCNPYLQWGFHSEIYPEQPVNQGLQQYPVINCTQYRS